MAVTQVPTRQQVEAAAALAAPFVRRTPVVDVDVDGVTVALKLELLQHTGSFKVRGAFASVLGAPEPPAVLVAASGGNHGLAVAHVGRELGVPARVFVPETAPEVKVRAIRALGADVRLVGTSYAEALAASREEGERPGALVLHAYDAPGTVTGQGTLGLEIADQVPGVDTVLVAVGGGGLLAGTTIGVAPARTVAVEPEGCPTLGSALAAGRPVDVAVGGVAADALGAGRIGAIAWQVVTDHRVRSVLVTGTAVTEARQWLWDRVRVAAEPAGAAVLAALRTGAYRPEPGERVCAIVCGGNADPAGL